MRYMRGLRGWGPIANFDQQGEAGGAFHHGCHGGEPALADDEVALLTL